TKTLKLVSVLFYIVCVLQKYLLKCGVLPQRRPETGRGSPPSLSRLLQSQFRNLTLGRDERTVLREGGCRRPPSASCPSLSKVWTCPSSFR
uniref:Uncharacterized protein n=1 Tax=Echeneis naucrates TaxID=173247 RepID=A0A665WS31_ECHNA